MLAIVELLVALGRRESRNGQAVVESPPSSDMGRPSLVGARREVWIVWMDEDVDIFGKAIAPRPKRALSRLLAKSRT